MLGYLTFINIPLILLQYFSCNYINTNVLVTLILPAPILTFLNTTVIHSQHCVRKN